MKGKNLVSILAVLVISMLMAVSALAAVPVITAPASQTVNEGQLMSFQVSASNPGATTMVFSTTNLPAGASLTTTSSSPGLLIGQFNWVPNFNQAGTYNNFQITVTDSLAFSATTVVQLIVNDVATTSTSSGTQITKVELDNSDLTDSSTNFVMDVNRGDSFEVKVSVMSNSDVKDAQVSASIRGFDNRQSIDDLSNTFDMKAGVTYVKKLSLTLPDRVDQDRYKLRVQVENRDSPTVEKTYELEISTDRHALKIKDVVLNPEQEVIAGRSVIAIARIQNLGQKEEKGIKIKVSIPQLGVSATDYMDSLTKAGTTDDEATSEELLLRIPASAKPGNYQVLTEVTFQDGDQQVSKSMDIRVVSAEAAPSVAGDNVKVTINYPAEKQDVAAGGAGSAFPITFINSGSTSKAFTLDVDSNDWGTVKVSPSNLVTVKAGETATAYVFVSANEGIASGERAVVVNVRDTSGASIKQFSVRANVIGSSGSSFLSTRKLLEMGLIALIVILAIVAILVAFQRLKGDKEDAEESGQTYY